MIVTVLPVVSLVTFEKTSLKTSAKRCLGGFVTVESNIFRSVLAGSEVRRKCLCFMGKIACLARDPRIFRIVCASVCTVTVMVLVRRFRSGYFSFLFFFKALKLCVFVFANIERYLTVDVYVVTCQFTMEHGLV